MSGLNRAEECICTDRDGCLGDPGVASDCQPCLELHPAADCLRFTTSSSHSPTSGGTR